MNILKLYVQRGISEDEITTVGRDETEEKVNFLLANTGLCSQRDYFEWHPWSTRLSLHGRYRYVTHLPHNLLVR